MHNVAPHLAVVGILAFPAGPVSAAAVVHETASAVTVDQNGTIYVAGGVTEHDGAGGATANDLWVVRYDSGGNAIWRRQEVAAGSEDAVGVATDADGNLYLLGSTRDADDQPGITLAKFSPGGDTLWSLPRIQVPTDATAAYAHGLAVDGQGRSYVAGYYTSSDGDIDAWVGAYSAQGAPLWNTPLITARHEFAFGVAADPAGNAYVVGYTYGAGLAQTPADAASDDCDIDADGKRAFIAKLTPQGAVTWTQELTLSGSDVLSAVTVDPHSQAVYAAGYASGSVATGAAGNDSEALLARFDGNGTLTWYQQFGDDGDDVALALAADNRGGVTVAGYHESATKLQTSDDPWLARFNSDGKLLWRETLTVTGQQDVGRALAAGADGEPVLVGDSATSGSSGNEAWVAKFDLQGEREWLGVIRAAPVTASRTRPAASTGAIAKELVTPSATDPAIRHWNDPHLVYRGPGGDTNPTLFLYLPGSNGKPTGATLLLGALAATGHYAIALRYPNSWAVGLICSKKDPNNDACFGQIRAEIVTGHDLSQYMQVDRANSIEGRLTSLLQYLAQQHPEQGWERWLEDGEPVWENIVVSGHSQGGGHAAMIGKLHPVKRVVMLAAPADNLEDGSSAPWLSSDGATPPERQFGLVHINDPGYDHVRLNWVSLGLCRFGPATLIDEPFPPSSGTHQLVTSIPPENGIDHGRDAHGSVATDGKTPVTGDNDALYADDQVWDYVFGTL